MGKMKIGIYCCFIADILTKVFLQMFHVWSSNKHILFVKTSQFAKNIKQSTQKLYGR